MAITAIAFSCPHCSRPHRVDPKHAGKLIKCKKCAQPIRVPGKKVTVAPSHPTAPEEPHVPLVAPLEGPTAPSVPETPVAPVEKEAPPISMEIEPESPPAGTVEHEPAMPVAEISPAPEPKVSAPPEPAPEEKLPEVEVAAAPIEPEAPPAPPIAKAEPEVTLPAEEEEEEPAISFENAAVAAEPAVEGPSMHHGLPREPEPLELDVEKEAAPEAPVAEIAAPEPPAEEPAAEAEIPVPAAEPVAEEPFVPLEAGPSDLEKALQAMEVDHEEEEPAPIAESPVEPEMTQEVPSGRVAEPEIPVAEEEHAAVVPEPEMPAPSLESAPALEPDFAEPELPELEPAGAQARAPMPEPPASEPLTVDARIEASPVTSAAASISRTSSAAVSDEPDRPSPFTPAELAALLTQRTVTEPAPELETRPPSTAMPPSPTTTIFYRSPYFSLIKEHLDKTVGPITRALHEAKPIGVQIDVHIIPPTYQPPSEEHPRGTSHFTMVTCGMSSRQMNKPAGVPGSSLAELMIALPPNWPGVYPNGTFNDYILRQETSWWPFRWLITLGRTPHVSVPGAQFIGPGYIMLNGEPQRPLATNTKLSGLLVMPSALSPKAMNVMNGESIRLQIYALWPVYAEEMALARDKGLPVLMDLFKKNNVTELIDINRLNVAI